VPAGWQAAAVGAPTWPPAAASDADVSAARSVRCAGAVCHRLVAADRVCDGVCSRLAWRVSVPWRVFVCACVVLRAVLVCRVACVCVCVWRVCACVCCSLPCSTTAAGAVCSSPAGGMWQSAARECDFVAWCDFFCGRAECCVGPFRPSCSWVHMRPCRVVACGCMCGRSQRVLL
jgi:hypothetical protein